MSSNDAPPAPDYSPMMAAFAQIAATSEKNSADALAWAREQAASNKDLLNTVNKNLLDITATSNTRAQEQAAASKALLDQGTAALKDNLAKYQDPARKQAAMGEAQAGVAQNFDAARASSTQELEGYGINPSATRFAALDLGLRAQKAAAMASAGNIASRQNDQLADAAIDKIVAQGNAGAQLTNQTTGVGANAAAGALSGSLATTASGANTLGTANQWTGTGLNATTGQTSTQNQAYQNQLDKTKADNASSSGLGSLLGVGASMLGKGGALASGGALAFLEDGGMMPGAIPDPNATEGGAVPAEASPSGGAIPDDINAKINAGEFVMPKDVTSWYGEEKMQKMIDKAREAKAKATAKPAMAIPAGPPPANADFISRPSAGAIPAAA